MTLSRMTLSILGLFTTLSVNDTQHNDTQHNSIGSVMLGVIILSTFTPNAIMLNDVMLSVVMPNVVVLWVVMLSVVMWNVIMLGIVMLNVVARLVPGFLKFQFLYQVWLTQRRAEQSTNRGLRESLRPLQHRGPLHPNRDPAGSGYIPRAGLGSRQLPPGCRNFPGVNVIKKFGTDHGHKRIHRLREY